jgi:isochorismate synthase
MKESQQRAGVAADRARAQREHAFHFSSLMGSFTARDAGTPLDLAQSRDLAGDAMRALRERARGFVAGAFAFDRMQPARLSLHAGLAEADHRPRSEEPRTPQARTSFRTSHQPTPQGYMNAVAQAVARIRGGELRKVVLARALDLEFARQLDLTVLLDRLREQNPGKYIFRCDISPSARERRVIIGASPELLVAKRGDAVVSHPLAGSLPRSADSVEDGARAARLLKSTKNLREHAFVVEAVADALTPYCRELNVPRRPALVQTPTMWHLGSKVRGRLREDRISSLQLALALHPTPAVCGEPRARAASAIAALEGFDRGFFAGAVGYCDRAGDGEWAVTIRCAQISERGVRLYAGAGIVAESIPEDELAETAAKLRTMLQALGLEQLEGR